MFSLVIISRSSPSKDYSQTQLTRSASNPLIQSTDGRMADPNMFTTPFQLTKSMHCDVYPAVDPSNPALAAKGKVVIITGAGGGI